MTDTQMGRRAAVLGSPIRHSLSPVLHEAAYQALGLRGWHYDTIECDEPGLPRLVDGMGPQWAGLSLTMPHKVTTSRLVDEVTPTVQIAGAVNAVLLRSDGTLLGDQFDGAGFVRGAERNGFQLAGKRALVVGNGGAGSAIAASLAGAGVSALALFDPDQEASESLAARIGAHYPRIRIATGSSDPEGYDAVVNATPLGMNEGDPLPVDVDRICPGTFVGEVVMKQRITPFLQAARDKGCPIQVGTDMLFEQIPACLEFFGLGTATPGALRAVAQIKA